MPIAGSAHWVKASHGELDPQLLKRRGEGRFAKLTSEVRLDAKERKGSNDVLASRVSRDHASLWEERGGEVTVAFGLDRIDRNDRVGNSWTDPIGLARQKKQSRRQSLRWKSMALMRLMASGLGAVESSTSKPAC